MTLVQTGVPAAKLTEGLTWLLTGLGVGVACGAALSGWIVDGYGARSGFAVSLSAAVLVVLVVMRGRRRQGALA